MCKLDFAKVSCTHQYYTDPSFIQLKMLHCMKTLYELKAGNRHKKCNYFAQDEGDVNKEIHGSTLHIERRGVKKMSLPVGDSGTRHQLLHPL